MISLIFLTAVFLSLSVLIPLVNKDLQVKGILLTVFLGILALIFAYITKFYFSVRNLESAFTYENGELNDYSKPFNRARGIKKEDIKSITQWSENRGINQYILIKKNFGLGGNALMHQLKGNHIYLSDYIVDSEALKKLIQLIESEREKQQDEI